MPSKSNTTIIQRTCGKCLKLFTPKTSPRRNQKHFYCSAKCKNQRGSNKIERECLNCGEKFWKYPSQINHRDAPGNFHNQKCHYEYRYKYWEQKFWDRIDTSGECWLWTGKGRRNGYGSIRIKGKQEATHRVAYKITYGPIPNDLYVCHKCDTRLCCRPDHLFLGTQLDNIRDAKIKNRRAIGENHGRARVTNDQVREIRYRFDSGERQIDIATEFNLPKTLIQRIVRYKNFINID